VARAGKTALALASCVLLVTSDMVMLSWCTDTGDLILWEGRAPGPKGEGTSTEFPVSYARDVTLEQIESASQGASLEMVAWPTDRPTE